MRLFVSMLFFASVLGGAYHEKSFSIIDTIYHLFFFILLQFLFLYRILISGADLAKNLTRAQFEFYGWRHLNTWNLIWKNKTMKIWLGLKLLSPPSGSAPVCILYIKLIIGFCHRTSVQVGIHYFSFFQEMRILLSRSNDQL